MKFFPESTIHQLEFDKVKELLAGHCKTEYAKELSQNLRIHTKKEFIELALQQGHEFKTITQTGLNFPNDFSVSISREIKLLSIPGASLTGEQFMLIRRLAENTASIFRWFTDDTRLAYPALTRVIDNSYYEKILKLVLKQC
jgi:DNA mismatch repair protein MutS2